MLLGCLADNPQLGNTYVWTSRATSNFLTKPDMKKITILNKIENVKRKPMAYEPNLIHKKFHEKKRKVGWTKLSIIRHAFLQKCNWTRIFRGEFVEGNIILLFIVHMTHCHDCLHQSPIPTSLIQILSINTNKTKQK